MDSKDEIQARWEELIEKKALVPEGVDEDGDVVYVIDPEVLEVVDPALYQAYVDEIDEALAGLFAKGLIEAEFTDDGVGYHLSERGEEWRRLHEESQATLLHAQRGDTQLHRL